MVEFPQRNNFGSYFSDKSEKKSVYYFSSLLKSEFRARKFNVLTLFSTCCCVLYRRKTSNWKQETSNRKHETSNRKQETSNRKQETSNKKQETSNKFYELIYYGRIWRRFANQGRSRESKFRVIRSCFRFVCTLLSFF